MEFILRDAASGLYLVDMTMDQKITLSLLQRHALRFPDEAEAINGAACIANVGDLVGAFEFVVVPFYAEAQRAGWSY